MGPILGIDFGTNNTLAYKKDIILDVPSIVAKNTKSNKVIAIGDNALSMDGKNPLNVITSRPLNKGVISEYVNSKLMLSFILKQIYPISLFKPILVMSVPSHINQVERRAFVNIAFELGIKDVYLIEEPWAAALGANLSIDEPGGNMVVDIGGGITDIGILSINSIVTSENISIGGNDFDKSIIDYLRKKYNFIIGNNTAENIKKEIGSLCGVINKKMDINGVDLINSNPKILSITSKDIEEAILPLVNQICIRIKDLFDKISPDLCGDIMDRGIYLTGGSSLLKGIDKYINEYIGVPVHIAENPRHCVIKGCGKSFNMLEQIKEEYIQVINI